ncbi:MAG: hypothetical protein QOH52_2662 [Pseudonocardiales bacterium]|jgi:hypothetical protein|nr:hypothetical protein [Pseudonocardiales bacterium]
MTGVVALDAWRQDRRSDRLRDDLVEQIEEMKRQLTHLSDQSDKSASRVCTKSGRFVAARQFIDTGFRAMEYALQELAD